MGPGVQSWGMGEEGTVNPFQSFPDTWHCVESQPCVDGWISWGHTVPSSCKVDTEQLERLFFPSGDRHYAIGKPRQKQGEFLLCYKMLALSEAQVMGDSLHAVSRCLFIFNSVIRPDSVSSSVKESLTSAESQKCIIQGRRILGVTMCT